jgi:hypothetical protein
LWALRPHRIFDPPAEAEFDDLVRVASLLCGTPVSVVSC